MHSRQCASEHRSCRVFLPLVQKHLVENQDDDDFSLHARMIMSLAFVPTADLDNDFGDLFNELRANFNNELDVIIDYFDRLIFRWLLTFFGIQGHFISGYPLE